MDHAPGQGSRDDVVTVFVYGSLLKGFWNHRPYAPLLVACERAYVDGLRLLHLPEGYPGAVVGDGVVVGEVQTFRQGSQVLASLDELEDCDLERPEASMYLRRSLKANTAQRGVQMAWVYLYVGASSGEAMARGAVWIPSGDWRAFMGERR
ncbi:MAG: gamma-glutamylcyclotransferase family protein [Myxococcota bacterium]